jgi:hypothetical protein
MISGSNDIAPPFRQHDRERSCCAPRLVGAGSRSAGGLRFIPIREAPRLKGGELHSP